MVSRLLAAWAQAGFEQVAPIQVDEAQILLKNRSAQIANRTFRFMDPASGAMLALLPDVTLGIARLAMGELAQAPRPLRLSYEGQAIRVSGSPSRPARQFGQVGLEVIGSQPDMLKELTGLALKSLSDLGVSGLHLCLVHPPLAHDMISRLGLPSALAAALDRKDEGKIRALAGEQAAHFFAILAGDFSGEPALKPLQELREDLCADFPDVVIRCEPFEQRGFALQTGPSFALYADSFRGELGRGGAYEVNGEACFGFTFYRDALLQTLIQK